MTVRDILINTGVMIGRPDVVDYFCDQVNMGEDVYEDIAFLVKIVNVVITELASTYIPLTTKEEVTFYDGKFQYAEFYKKAVKIVAVYDNLGNKIAFTETAEYIQLENFNSKSLNLTVEYQFLPEEYYEDSEVDYTERIIPAKVLAYGVAAEFCISQSRFEEAVMHHKRYMFALQEIKGIKNASIKSRSWV